MQIQLPSAAAPPPPPAASAVCRARAQVARRLGLEDHTNTARWFEVAALWDAAAAAPADLDLRDRARSLHARLDDAAVA